jgi:hypothetical protein
MPAPRTPTVTKAREVAPEQQGAVRDPARRAERLRSAGPFVATGSRDVRRINIGRVVADAPGKRLAPAVFREVSPPGSSMCDVDRLRSIPDSLCRLAL